MEACGLIPPDRASPLSYSLMLRVAPENQIARIRAWAAMGTTKRDKQAKGSWFAGLVSTGALPAGVRPSR